MREQVINVAELREAQLEAYQAGWRAGAKDAGVRFGAPESSESRIRVSFGVWWVQILAEGLESDNDNEGSKGARHVQGRR